MNYYTDSYVTFWANDDFLIHCCKTHVYDHTGTHIQLQRKPGLIKPGLIKSLKRGT